VNPLDALTDSNPKAPASDPAPAAAAWLQNPTSQVRETLTQRTLRELELDLQLHGQHPWPAPDDPYWTEDVDPRCIDPACPCHRTNETEDTDNAE
jgi:hypothetical protein